MIMRLALALALLFASAVAHAAEDVAFDSLDGTRLEARLFRPVSAGPYPAVVALHGCSGLRGPRGGIRAIYREWAAHLSQAGFVVLLVDSARPRGIATACVGVADRAALFDARAKDAYAALAYLQTQAFVKPDRIGVMGWSQGGGTVLAAIPETSRGRPAPPPVQDFRAAVALYPALCSERVQARLFGAERSWTTAVPLLVLFGEADNWTPYPPCRAFIAAAQARSALVALQAYPDAHHAFDAPNAPLRELPHYRTPRGVVPLVGTNEPARQDAYQRATAWFLRHLRD